MISLDTAEYFIPSGPLKVINTHIMVYVYQPNIMTSGQFYASITYYCRSSDSSTIVQAGLPSQRY